MPKSVKRKEKKTQNADIGGKRGSKHTLKALQNWLNKEPNEILQRVVDRKQAVNHLQSLFKPSLHTILDHIYAMWL